jgi:hypothetical protein
LIDLVSAIPECIISEWYWTSCISTDTDDHEIHLWDDIRKWESTRIATISEEDDMERILMSSIESIDERKNTLDITPTIIEDGRDLRESRLEGRGI